MAFLVHYSAVQQIYLFFVIFTYFILSAFLLENKPSLMIFRPFRHKTISAGDMLTALFKASIFAFPFLYFRLYLFAVMFVFSNFDQPFDV